MRRTQNRKQTTRQKRRTHKRKRSILTGGSGFLSQSNSISILDYLNSPAIKTQLRTIRELPNETGVTNVKTAYSKTLKTEELYDIITPSDGSAVKVWSHGTGQSASASVTAGIPGKHVYITGGQAPQVVGVVIRSST
jgi:hypothetical protein